MGLSLPSAQPAPCDSSHPRHYKVLDRRSQVLKETPSMMAVPPSACSESKALSRHWLKQQPEKAVRIKGWRREAGILLALLPAQLMWTSGSLLGKGKRHRGTGWFQANYLHFSSPLSLPNLGSTVKFLPTAFPGHEPLHTAERRAGTRLVTHPCPSITKLKFCLYILKLARFKFTWTLPFQLCSTTCGEAQRSLLRIFLILQQPSGDETQASPTLPALAEGLIHQAWLSKAICQTTELLVGCLDAVSCPYVYQAVLPVQCPLWERFRAQFRISTWEPIPQFKLIT